MEVFSERLRKIRREAKESQRALGKIIDVSASQIADIESGRRGTTIDKLAEICRHYKVSADYLLGLTDKR